VNVRKLKRNSWAGKQTQLGNGVRNCQRIETVSIWQFSCLTRQTSGNSRCQTGNFVERQSCSTMLRVWHRPTGDASYICELHAWSSQQILYALPFYVLHQWSQFRQLSTSLSSVYELRTSVNTSRVKTIRLASTSSSSQAKRGEETSHFLAVFINISQTVETCP